MSKNKKIIGSAALSFLLIFTGCTQLNRYDKFSKNDQSLSWVGERKRSFGDSDYSKVKNEKEAFNLLKEKYQLSIPNYYKETKKLINQTMSSENVKAGETKYSIFSRNEELQFKTIYTFYKEKELQILAEVGVNYKYSADKKQSYLKSQIVRIQIAPIKGKLPNDNLSEVIRKLGNKMKISKEKIDSGIAGYEKRVKETAIPITEDYLPIISNSAGLRKNEEFLKEIAIVYDQDGTVREVYAEISESD